MQLLLRFSTFTLVGFLASAKMNNSQFELNLNILVYIYNRSYLIKADELSETFDLSKRSIRRIISNLRMIGYNIESIPGPNGGYRLDKSKIILPVKLSDLEMSHWQTIENTIKSADISNKEAVLKTMNIISIQSQLNSNYLADVYVTKSLSQSKQALIERVEKTMNQAMNLMQRVEIKYNGSDWREFRPQQFQIFNSIAYIKGYYSLESNSFRTLRLSRFDDIRVIDKKYSFNDNFALDNDSSAFSKNIYEKYSLMIKVFKGSHDLLDYVYGQNQVIEEYADHYLLKFEMSGDQLIVDLIISFQEHAILLEPQALRMKVIEKLDRMRGNY